MRSEQSLIDVFARIWGTEELLVSIGRSFPRYLTLLLMAGDQTQ